MPPLLGVLFDLKKSCDAVSRAFVGDAVSLGMTTPLSLGEAAGISRRPLFKGKTRAFHQA
jgi:hypothetical protein